jgi:3-hydroxyisobutyrate dehydrogenase-like beta-hydroxyacid dehydrogenase
MGSSIGRVLLKGGLQPLVCLEGRSDLSRLRAQESGFRELPSLDALVSEADMIISILVPAEAEATARLMADSMKRTGAHPPFLECNALSPASMERVTGMFASTGAALIDGFVFGGPPDIEDNTWICYSGPETASMESLGKAGLNVRSVGQRIGQAAALKMLDSASRKAVTALWTEVLIAAQAMDLYGALGELYAINGDKTFEEKSRHLAHIAPRVRRFVGEMEEIATTFEQLGLTPRMLAGAADLFRLVGETPLGALTPRDPEPTVEHFLQTAAEAARQVAPK